jgi:hypothetical protein
MKRSMSILYVVFALVGCGSETDSKPSSSTIDAACISNPPAEASQGQDVRYYCKEYRGVTSDDAGAQSQCFLNNVIRGYSPEWKPNEQCPTDKLVGKCKLTVGSYTFTTFYYTFPDGLSDWPNNALEAEQHCLNGDGESRPAGAWTAS